MCYAQIVFIMCGEVPPGHYKIDVVVHLGTNESTIKIPLQRKMEWVREIWLTEYQVINSPTIGLFRIALSDALTEQSVTNATGHGMCFAVDNTVVSHNVYEKPRIVTVENRGQLIELDVKVRDVSTGAVVVPTFTNATFFFTFVMKDPLWNPDEIIAQDIRLPQNAAGQFSTRAPFF